MATIKQIDGRTVHQIQSGQVIIDLCSVVKELVENSIDAGATSIDVRFRNQGLDLIEIQDNGSGISPANYTALALKHHTSKLSSYSDIASLQTFGFRGEALASLCALSILSVTTCLSVDVPKGSKLTFEPSGNLRGTTVVAAQKGTTVSVENLFHNLPVRRRELERNIKREWHKVITLLNQYACIQINLKFTVSQQPTKGKRILLFSTKGNPTTRENIINIFGAKTMTALVPLDLRLELQPSTVGRGPQRRTIDPSSSKDVRVVGHVSRPTHGDGRQTPDRQMFFVNGRPCGLPQFAKTFNEVYRSYNSSQNPFILADIRLDTDMYDVNVSPDKRSILLHYQNNLLDNLRSSLTNLFDSQDYLVPTSQLLKPRQSLEQSKISQEPSAKSLPKALASADESDPKTDSQSESEVDADELSSSRVPLGRARIIPTARSLFRDTSGQNLISRWVERKTGNRPEKENDSSSPARELPSKPAPESTALLAGLETYTVESTNTPRGEYNGKPRPVQDFNRRLQKESNNTTIDTVARESSPSASPPMDAHENFEPPIPTVQPMRASSSVQVEHAIDTRAHASDEKATTQAAMINIGDRYDTSIIDSPWEPSPHVDPGRSTVRGNGALIQAPQPSFGGHLSQLFLAKENSKDTNDTDESSLDEKSDRSSRLHGRDAVQNNATLDDSNNFPEEERSSSSLFVSQDSPDRDKIGADDISAGESGTSTPDEATRDQCAPDPRGQFLKGGMRKKDSTLQTVHHLKVDENLIQTRMRNWKLCVTESNSTVSSHKIVADLGAADAEEQLSLIISKGDFSKMRIAGQFNLGFIIAIRSTNTVSEEGTDSAGGDELLIIDQHATDEKYNFEKLQATTVVQSQRLVRPKQLELTALEEEIVMQNIMAIEANGFKVHVDTSGDEPVGSRCQILALPLSRETTFTLADFEELVSLLSDESTESKHIPRPSKVRKMFAMRACRSSIMIGKALTQSQMETLVRHMGELDKPWNCPHGRPTMRHLCKLQPWDETGWKNDRQRASSATSWSSYARGD
ncbi:Fc.00g086200.m01.CDS01 [Cosmosporella sp. VM-42]